MMVKAWVPAGKTVAENGLRARTEAKREMAVSMTSVVMSNDPAGMSGLMPGR